jgi:hypothetical protein
MQIPVTRDFHNAWGGVLIGEISNHQFPAAGYKPQQSFQKENESPVVEVAE